MPGWYLDDDDDDDDDDDAYIQWTHVLSCTFEGQIVQVRFEPLDNKHEQFYHSGENLSKISLIFWISW